MNNQKGRKPKLLASAINSSPDQALLNPIANTAAPNARHEIDPGET